MLLSKIMAHIIVATKYYLNIPWALVNCNKIIARSRDKQLFWHLFNLPWTIGSELTCGRPLFGLGKDNG